MKIKKFLPSLPTRLVGVGACSKKISPLVPTIYPSSSATQARNVPCRRASLKYRCVACRKASACCSSVISPISAKKATRRLVRASMSSAMAWRMMGIAISLMVGLKRDGFDRPSRRFILMIRPLPEQVMQPAFGLSLHPCYDLSLVQELPPQLVVRRDLPLSYPPWRRLLETQ